MPGPKEQIGKLMREVGELLTVSAAADVLGVSKTEASKMLARWVTQGWLTRIRRGLYAIVPIDALNNQQALDDEWVLVPELYSPGYIGGWSASEYWDFTEQVFREVCVLTEQPVIHKKHEVYHIAFLLTHIPQKMNFATKTIWKKNRKIFISDPHKTMIDMLYSPQLGGGIQHIVDCFKAYVDSVHHSPEKLAAYVIQVGSGAVFKRLGFLYSKIIGHENELTKMCRQHLTQGIAYLDPAIKHGRIITQWRLHVPEQLQF
ncbi:MAG: type IV toxin-antitoxin system AbiEi family antitoxin domain-containing protein [Gammaproteobacteria bacterium]|nr:type IV toxin-antitoxin system AbiEi family antitoxin domain-containing protein [Gammaproteobacteria bacterium]MCH9764309.1 type IV toxin-antitoxin system AbiEi family antitoxin domain-containing protein [Gammaproteobacteria bacterium]